MMKTNSVVRKLRDAYNVMLSVAPDSNSQKCAQHLHDILSVLRE